MRGFAFFLDAFFALLFLAYFAHLELPTQPAFENLSALKVAFRLAQTTDDAAFLDLNALSGIAVPSGYCVRIRESERIVFQSCLAARWVGVPRTVYRDGTFTLYRVDAGEKIA